MIGEEPGADSIRGAVAICRGEGGHPGGVVPG